MITRTEVSSLSDIATALGALVPDFFASATYDSKNNKVIIKDADENTIFEIGSQMNLTKAYRSASSALAPVAGSPMLTTPKYFYNMGANGAALAFQTGQFIAIAKAANGKTAFVYPSLASTLRFDLIYSACWGDDTAFTGQYSIADTVDATTGNNCLFVPVPLFGSYQTPNNVPKVFFMPVAQTNMRGILQEVTSDSGTYVTNGYVAMIYEDE